MPVLRRGGNPSLFYEVDDYTDPWRNAPFILLQHGYGRSSKFWYRWEGSSGCCSRRSARAGCAR